MKTEEEKIEITKEAARQALNSIINYGLHPEQWERYLKTLGFTTTPDASRERSFARLQRLESFAVRMTAACADDGIGDSVSNAAKEALKD